MNKTLTAIVLALVPAVLAAGPASGGAAAEQLGVSQNAHGAEAVGPKGMIVSYGYSSDCKMVYFGSEGSGSGQSSGVLRLESVYKEKDCPSGGDLLNCQELEGQRLRADVEVRMAPRELYPWESESVDVCLQGKELMVKPWNVSYEYTVSKTNENWLAVYTFSPTARKASHPDPKGLTSEGYHKTGAGYSAVFKDKWGREYSGEKVEVQVQLWRKGSLLRPAKMVGRVGAKFEAAGEYQLDFTSADISGAPDAKGYYLSWGFRRLGGISLPVLVQARDALSPLN
ncbi:MAG: hypothetical protein A2049_10335 [Elusimicrobia bacterium GWA2_62_23]|nr:MAG: hypothetical protein A2049_10335 [Elusimicrobia bacterium GWA2_62_23]OGR66516.1 MAG: hypothetical protein A2179_04685 [Elusimicrobia bacterium GWC2_63_65]